MYTLKYNNNIYSISCGGHWGANIYQLLKCYSRVQEAQINFPYKHQGHPYSQHLVFYFSDPYNDIFKKIHFVFEFERKLWGTYRRLHLETLDGETISSPLCLEPKIKGMSSG